MNYLLDTHTILWFIENSENLSKNAYEKITNPNNKNYISIVSIWETAIKMNIGKLKFNGGFSAFQDLINIGGIEILQIKSRYMEKLFDLPLIHRDPFDRLITSTAICEKMIILTKDENIQKYDVLSDW